MCLYLIVVATALSAQSPLTLEDAIDLALKNNFDIRISRTASQVAQANNTAGNAGMLPNLSANTSAALTQSEYQSLTMSNVYTRSSYVGMSANAYLQLDWTLYDGGKMFVTRQKLRETDQLGALRLRESVQATLYEVIASYYNLIRLQQQLRSVQQTIRYNQERVTIAQAGFNSGALSKPDLLQAKTDLNEVLESAINQEFAIRDAQRNLNALLARDTESPLKVADSIPTGYQPNRADLYQRLNSSNTSLLALKKQLEINRSALRETKAAFLPLVSFSASYLLSGSTDFNGSRLDDYRQGPTVSAGVRIPIYQGGEANRKKKVAELQSASVQADLEKLQLEMNLALQNALNEFDNHQALLKIEQENNLMTKEYLEISIQRLRLGQTNSLEVHLAQEKFMNSNTRLINYRFNLKLAETRLRQLAAAL